jgi:pimeloyl-ACP methyl ester carboxylesterase
VIAAANPLRGPAADAAAVSDVVRTVDGPVVLVGHSYGNIPVELQRFMAKRARAHRIIEIPGASHAVPVAHPGATAHLILQAASLPVAA